MLTERFGQSDLSDVIRPLDQYHPFPTADERASWEGLPAGIRQAAVDGAERLLNHQWPALPATLYMDFARTGNRSRYEGPYFTRRGALEALVIAECVEGKGRFLDDIINGIWAICEESSWVIPAHNSAGTPLPDVAAPAIDLFAAETGALLAWTHYLLRSRLDNADRRIAERIRREVGARILDPFLTHDDYWWMGVGRERRLNNWSPWCSSNVLASFLLLEPDPERRTQAVRKAMRIVDRWLAGYHPDGCCDEGPSYWGVAGASLLDCLELLRGASGGKIDVYDQPLIQEIGRYIYRAHISGDYFIDFADCHAQVHIPTGLVYRYGRHIGDGQMAALGASVVHHRGAESLLRGALLRVLPNLFDADGITVPAEPPHVRDVWLEGTQIAAAREHDGTDRGLYLAAKGGHNAENHNHNDVGQFMMYYDGQPVLVDVGVGTYTRQTFSDRRYEIWTMQSAYHNCPTVNGVQQGVGEKFHATDVRYSADLAAAEFGLDIAAAYPASSGIKSWRRTCRLVREGAPQVEIVEDFALDRPTGDVKLSLMTPRRPQVGKSGVIALGRGSDRVQLAFDAKALSASVETIPLDDDSLRESWGPRMFRIVLQPHEAVSEGHWTLRIRKPASRSRANV